jgi:hypothetical protein
MSYGMDMGKPRYMSAPIVLNTKVRESEPPDEETSTPTPAKDAAQLFDDQLRALNAEALAYRRTIDALRAEIGAPPVGYVLACHPAWPPGHEVQLLIDWDGKVHPTLASARAELPNANGPDRTDGPYDYHVYELRKVR